MHECVECEMRVAWDFVDDTFWGFAASCASRPGVAKAVDIVPERLTAASGRALHGAGEQGVVPSAEEQKTRPSSTPVRTRKEKP
jgi:hypothetical protein